MSHTYSKKPEEQTEIALERIRILFREAEGVFPKEPKLANRYVLLARKIQMRYKVRMPSNLKKRFCRGCGVFLVTPANCRVRLRDSAALYTCLGCGEQMRFSYLREQKARRAARSPKPKNGDAK